MSKNLDELQKEICAWAATVWGDSRPPDGCITHLQLEARELEDAPYDIKEYADCLILLLNAAGLAGLSTDDLMEAAWRKHEVNMARKWGPVDARGVSEHIKDQADPASTTA